MNNTEDIEVTQKSKFHCCIPNCTYSKGNFLRIPNGKTSEWDNIIKTEFPNFLYDVNHRICAKHFSHFNFKLTHQKLLKFSKSYDNDSVSLNNRSGPRMSFGAEETALRLQSPEHVIEISATEGLPSPLREIIAETVVVNESFPSSDFQDSYKKQGHYQLNEWQSELDKSFSNRPEKIFNRYHVEKEVRYPKCCIPNCTTSRKTNRNAHLFHFPKFKSSDWIEKIKAHHSDYVYRNHHRICSRHFSENNFTSTLYTRLCKFAYPDLFGDNLPDRNVNIACSKKLLPLPGHSIQKVDASKNSLNSSHNISEIRAGILPTSNYHIVKNIPPNVNSNTSEIENEVTTVGISSPRPQLEKAHDCYSASSQNQVNTSASTFVSDKLPTQDSRIDQGKVSQNNLILSSKENEFHPNDKIHYTEYSTTDQNSPDSPLTESLATDQELPDSPLTDETDAHNNHVLSGDVNELHRNEDINRIHDSSPIVNEIDQHDNSLSKTHQQISQNNQVLPSNVHELRQNNGLHPPISESQNNNQEKNFQNNLVSSSNMNESGRSNSLHPLQKPHQPSEADQLLISQNNQDLSSKINELRPPYSGSSKTDQETFSQDDLTLCNIANDVHPTQSVSKISKKKNKKKRTSEKNTNNIICCVPNCGMSTFSNPDVHFFKFPQRKAMEWTSTIRSKFSSYSYKFDHKICQFHFSDSYFNSTSHNRLKNHALPSLFVNKNLL